MILVFNQPISSNISRDEKDSFKNKKNWSQKLLRFLKVMSPLGYLLYLNSNYLTKKFIASIEIRDRLAPHHVYVKQLKDNYFVRPLLRLGEAQYITDIVD